MRPVELNEASFAAALSAAQAGDVVVIPEGTLTLSTGYTVSKGITIRGSGNRATVIKTTSTTACPFALRAAGAVLDNMTIDGCEISGDDGSNWVYPPAAVELQCGLMTNVTVRNCRPRGATNVSAVRVGFNTPAADARMSVCTITNNNLGNIKSSFGTVTVNNGIVSRCEIAHNKGRGAVGFFLHLHNIFSLTLRIEDCDVHHNVCHAQGELASGVTVGSGGGGRADGGTVARCTISNNVSHGDGGGLWLRGGTVENCLVANNSAAASGGGIVANVATPVVRFCNIGGNTAPTGPGVAVTDAAEFWACLIADNAAASDSDVSIGSGVAAVFNNCAFRPATYAYYNAAVSNPPWNKQIGSEPVFRADGSCLTIDSNSCIVVDSTDVQIADDFFGRARPINAMVDPSRVARYDIGCCEYDPHFSGTIYVSPTGGHVYPYATLETAATNIEAAIGVCTNVANRDLRIVLTPGTYVRETALVVPPRTTLCGRTPLGSVVVKRTTAGDGVIVLDDASSVVSNIAVRGGIGRGSDNATTPGPSGLWVKQGLAVDCEISGCTIDPAAYANAGKHAQALVVGANATALRCIVTNNVGSFGTYRLSDRYPRGSAVFLDKGSRLQSCEIANNTGNIGGVYTVGVTEGERPCTVDDCFVHDNFAYGTGGGILNACNDSRYTNCRIVNNRVAEGTPGSTSSGGGVRMIATATFVNCLIAGNEADHGAGYACLGCRQMLLHCTIAGNRACTSVGGFWMTEDPYAELTMLDTLVAANTSPDDIELKIGQSVTQPVAITFSFLPQGRYAMSGPGLVMSNNVISANAKFSDVAAGDYRLRSGSPCIDAGTSAYPAGFASLVSKDLDGVDRPQNGKGTGTPRPDLGCYEYLKRFGFLILVN